MDSYHFTIYKSDVMRNKHITAGARLFYGDLLSLCDEKGFYYGALDKISILEGVKTAQLKCWVNSLVKAGCLIVHKENSIVSVLKGKKMSGLGFGNKVCLWCRVNTSVLHYHHYPVPKSKGGTDTVGICPNCHHEFHFNEGFYEIVLSNAELMEINKIKNEHFKANIGAK